MEIDSFPVFIPDVDAASDHTFDREFMKNALGGSIQPLIVRFVSQCRHQPPTDMPLQSSGLLLAKRLWQKHETSLVTFVPVWTTILGALQRLVKMDTYSWVLARRKILSSFLKYTVCLLD